MGQPDAQVQGQNWPLLCSPTQQGPGHTAVNENRARGRNLTIAGDCPLYVEREMAPGSNIYRLMDNGNWLSRLGRSLEGKY